MKLTVENLNAVYDMLSDFFTESSTVHWWDPRHDTGMILDVERSYSDETTITAVFKLSNSVEKIEEYRAQEAEEEEKFRREWEEKTAAQREAERDYDDDDD